MASDELFLPEELDNHEYCCNVHSKSIAWSTKSRPVKKRKLKGAVGTSATGASSSGDGMRGRTFNPIPTEGLTAQYVKQYLPPQCGISKDTKRENRWTGRSVHFPGAGTKSKSYGRNTGYTDWGACKYVLEHLWKAHKEAVHESCPRDFDKLAIELGLE
eukprot:3134841-Amphidinium_carterae.2